LKISNDDYIYGARSAIQKAIRRGDVDLCKTAFDVLWKNEEQRKWLKWRIYSLVVEEAYYLSGELAVFLSSNPKTEKEWRTFLYKLCVAPKAKDNNALWFLYSKNHIQDIEYWSNRCNVAKFFFSFPGVSFTELSKNKNYIADLSNKMFDYIQKSKNLSLYESKAIELLHKRSLAGGMTGDRCICITAMLLIAELHINESQINELIEKSVQLWVKRYGVRKPKTVEYPWYVFDMHTQVGKIAMNIFLKKHAEKLGLQNIDFQWFWFWIESGVLADYLVFDDSKGWAAFTNKYYKSAYRKFASLPNMTYDESLKFWKERVVPNLKGLIEWLLNKRVKNY